METVRLLNHFCCQSNGKNKSTNLPERIGFIPLNMMKKLTLLSLMMLLAIPLLLAQQGPVTYAGKEVVTGSLPTAVTVPVTVENFVNVGDISLTLNFDNTVMQYNGIVNINPAITGIVSTAPADPSATQVIFGRTAAVTAGLPDGTVLFEINFVNFNGGTSLLEWDNSVPESNEYTEGNSGLGYDKSPFGDFFVDGFVSTIDASFTVSIPVCDNPNVATVTMTATGGSGNYIFKIDDGTPVTNTTGVFTITTSGTYAFSVSDALVNPSAEVMLDPAYDIYINPYAGRVLNNTTSTIYCTLQDAINAALDQDELHFLFPGDYPGFAFNDPNRTLTLLNMSGGEVHIEGASPALHVSAGHLSFDGVSFITATDDPTILIDGGKVTLRNCTITESTGFLQTGIAITAGELDAGIDMSPGRNVFVMDGNGKAITQSGASIANALCNYYGSVDYSVVTFVNDGVVAYDPWNDATLNNCIYSTSGGPVTYAAEVFAPAGTVLVPVTVDNLINVDAVSLAIVFDNSLISVTDVVNIYSGLAGSTWSVAGDTFFFGWNQSNPALPGLSLPGLGQKLFDIEFSTITGTYPLEWNNNPDINSEYQNKLIQGPYYDHPTATFYINGFISDLDGTFMGATNVICKGANDGTVTLAATGGSYPLHVFKLTNNGDASFVTNTTGYFTGVAPGTYTASVIDNDYPWVEFEIKNDIEILEPATPLAGAGFESYRVRCKGESNGQATMNASGGWGGILYSIDGTNYQVNNYFDALSVGIYTLYALDTGGCVITDTVNITEPIVALTASGVESKVVTCKGGSDGEITLTGYDGWGDYLYSKNNLDYFLTPTLTGFAAGTHTVYVKDDGGCTVPVTVTVTEPAAPLAATGVEYQMVSCFGYDDGEIEVTATGGWGTYEYSKDNITWQSSEILTGFAAGNHVIYVRDIVGCVVTTLPVTVTEPDFLTGVISGDNTVCYGTSATVDITLAGGTPNYVVQYTDGNIVYTTNSPITSVQITQPYTQTTTWTLVSLTDANGCTSTISGSATITVNPLPVVTDITIITDTDNQLTAPITLGGDLNSGYEICVDPVIPFHYLGVSSLSNTPVQLQTGNMNPFTLDVTSLPVDFYAYWDAKGVSATTVGGWEEIMWDIIDGTQPMFYMEYDGANYTLIDGLQYLVSGGTMKETLRISGDYPQGLYTFTGTVLDQNGCTSLPFDINLQMNSSPVVDDFALTHSTDQMNWDPVAGDLANDYELCVDAMEQFHYLDVTSVSSSVNPLATGVMNEFFLDVTSLPGDFYTYWDAKGVSATTVGGWKEIMWDIIDGTQPMFYLEYDGTDYVLIDGLQYQAGSGKQTLRISGDYPAGTYTFTGTVEDVNGCVSSPFDIELTMITMPQPEAGPDFIVCDAVSYQLEAVQSIYNGIWTYTGPGMATFSDDDNVSSTVTVDVAGEYTFTWTENNGICYKSDDVYITFLKGTIAEDYSITPKANVEAVSGAPVVARFTYNLPTPDVNADADIIMDGLLSLSSGTFPAGMKVIEARRVAPITTTWFKVVDGDLGGKDHIFLSNVIGVQNPLFNNVLNDYNWVLTLEDANGTTGTLDMNFALVTYQTRPTVISSDCYAVLDQINWMVTYDEAQMTAPDVATCDGDPLFFSAAINYPVIDNVDDNMEILLDAKISLNSGTFNAGTTLHWGYNDPPTNTSTVNVDGKTSIYLSEIVGIPSGTPMSAHSGTDTWNFVLNGLNVGAYDLTIEAIARITVVEPPLVPLQIPGKVANSSNQYYAPDPADYVTYEYAYATQNLTLTVNPLPTITLVNAAPKVCNGADEVELEYSAITNGADEYTIVWGTLALAEGFTNVVNIALPTTPIVVAIPGTAPAGVYEADLTVINSVTGCVSAIYPIEVHVPAPFAVNPQQTAVTCFGHNDGQAAANVTGSWGGYSFLWDDLAAQTTDPAVNLYAGVYNVTITDAEGCSTTATVTVTEPDVLDADVEAFDITCHGITDGIIEITNPTGGHYNYEFRLDNDAWSVTPTFTGLAAGTYEVQIRDADYPHCWISLGTYTIVEPAPITVSGNFNYHNLFNTPLNNVTVNLVDGSTTLYTGVTDATGHYHFANVCPGTYEMVATTVKPTQGAVNSTDAVQANIWGVSNGTIEMVQFNAGNVNNDVSVNAGDAGVILTHFVNGLTPPFPTDPWMFWTVNETISANPSAVGIYPEVTVVATDVVQDFYGLVTGDFNQSHTPNAAKLAGSVEITNLDAVIADGIDVFDLPVTVNADMDVSALSLILNFPADKVEVVGVTLGANAGVAVPFSVNNGELRIGYFTQMPIMLNEGNTLITLKLRSLSGMVPGDLVAFTAAIDPLNELAGADYQAMSFASLNISVVQGVVSVPKQPSSAQIGFGNYPNPFAGATTFTYDIPENGNVNISVFDLTGRKVAEVVNANHTAGQYTAPFEMGVLGAGIYMANLTLTTENGVESRTIRIVTRK